jgi:nicotinamide-nucleotide amidase
MHPPSFVVRSAEIVTVGTELLLGETLDTNGAWLASRLAERGVDVYWSLRVGDNLQRLREALEVGLARSDLVVTTGGLGPTEDDLTREAIAAVAGATPEVDPELAEELRAFFARLGRSMPEGNLKQAWRIPGAEILPNPRGTAPGWLVRIEREGGPRWIAALPGPPRELERMVEHELLPRLPIAEAHLWSRTLKTGGIGESHVAERIAAWTAGANPSVATYARADGVHVRIAAKAAREAEAEAIARPVADAVEEALAEHVWGRDDDVLAGLVVAAAEAADVRVAVVEDATRGRLATALTEADLRASVLAGAVVACRVEARTALGLPTSVGDGETAKAAAARIRAFFAADAAIAVGELRPADGEGGGVTVDVAVDDAEGSEAVTFTLPERDGSWLRDRVVLRSLDLLRRRLRRVRA